MREESHEGRLAKLAVDFAAAHVETEQAEKAKNKATEHYLKCRESQDRIGSELRESVSPKTRVRNFVVNGRLVRVEWVTGHNDSPSYSRVVVEDLTR